MCVCRGPGVVSYMHEAAGLHGHLSGETQGCVIYQRRGQDSLYRQGLRQPGEL